MAFPQQAMASGKCRLAPCGFRRDGGTRAGVEGMGMGLVFICRSFFISPVDTTEEWVVQESKRAFPPRSCPPLHLAPFAIALLSSPIPSLLIIPFTSLRLATSASPQACRSPMSASTGPLPPFLPLSLPPSFPPSPPPSLPVFHHRPFDSILYLPLSPVPPFLLPSSQHLPIRRCPDSDHGKGADRSVC